MVTLGMSLPRMTACPKRYLYYIPIAAISMLLLQRTAKALRFYFYMERRIYAGEKTKNR